MRKLFLSILIGCSIVCHGQNFKVQFGLEKDDPKKTETVALLHADNSKVFVLKHEILSSFMFGAAAGALTAPFIDKYYINQFNQNLSFTKKIQFNMDDKTLIYLDMYFHNNHFILFGGRYNKEQKKVELCVSNIDLNGKAKTVQTPLAEYANVKLGFDNSNMLNIRASQDSSRYIILGKEKIKESDVKGKFNNAIITVVDDNGNKLWQRDIEISGITTHTYISIDQTIISNNGDVYLLVKQYLDGTKKEKNEKGEPNYKHVLYAYSDGGKLINNYEINLGDYFSGRPELIQTKKGEVIAAGLLSEKKTGNFLGLFTLHLDALLSTPTLKKLLFNSDQLASNGSRLKYKNDEISQNFIVDDIIDFENGEYGISAEYFNYNPTGKSTTYYYRDILFCTVDQADNLKSVDIIPKNQVSNLPVGFSYKVFAYKGHPYFLFNDDIDNVGKAENEIAQSIRNPKNYAAVICYKEGNIWQRKLLFSKEDAEDNYLLPTDVQKINENSLILPCERKGDLIFAKLTME